jgi:predicted dehydrogenase
VSETKAQLNVAVIGCGYWGPNWLRNFQQLSDSRVVAAADSDESRLKYVRGLYPDISLTSDYRDLLASPTVQAVVIALPPRLHATVGLDALRAGKHVLLEKPMATSSTACRELMAEARARSLTLMVGHTFEYTEAVRKVKSLLDEGTPGELYYVNSQRLNLGLFQNDCNVIWDLAPHDISITSYLLDELPISVSVWAQRNVGPWNEDVAYLRLEFPSTHAFVHVSWLNPNKVRRTTVVGERRMAVFDDMSDNERIRVYDIGVDPREIDSPHMAHEMPVSYRTGDITSPFVPFREPLSVQDREFIDSIRTGSRSTTPGERGLDIVRVLAASDVSLATGRPARVETGLHVGTQIEAHS